MKAIFVALLLAAGGTAASAQKLPSFGGSATPSFAATLSNNTPLVFGMGLDEARRALGTPFTHVSGPPGEEVFLAFRDIGGSGLFPHHDRLYLQFRKGRLAGWKGDWGENWMWR
ncbi:MULTISPECIES: hypothetical protein [unclassified Bradyrhizobium]|uniref:hypothetical protein n=1 Tax=unclassified Bradyrhizobium TaxID=2631580 RepID=UPI002478B301|nr:MULTISPECIES: hypothetical protein [unclassified Bradyrhizobium]WGS20638.1 hypothetical protein MTX22_02105 [Bradyrhizobium sp. ISRA463]WGS27526.1 hypothetical protein MTX19_38975 [Bradyrhizobium sp. ISRA464]